MVDPAQGKCGDWLSLAIILVMLVLIPTPVGAVSMGWDGNTTLYDIDFRPENFLDINSDQFRPSQEIRWYGVENGWRVAGGSLESNRTYLIADVRLKRVITPSFFARLNWANEAFFSPRNPERPLLELELKPTAWPVSVSLLGAPAYAKSEADLGLALSLGMRPWDYLRIAWLRPDYYFKTKNAFDASYFRRSPNQIAVTAAYHVNERYKLRFSWYDNKPQEFVLDDQVSVFSYRNRNIHCSLDYRLKAVQTVGITLRGFDTRQSREDTDTLRIQDIRYRSVNAYWILDLGERARELTVGIRYDDFRNRERTLNDPTAEFDFLFKTAQVYSDYYLPFAVHHALDLGLYLGDVSKRRDYLDPSIADRRQGYFETMLRTGWDIYSSDRSTALTLAVSWNLDDLIGDSFDGGSVRFRSEF